MQSLNTRVTETLRVFAESMQELEQESIERLRTTLASGLNTVIRNLGEQFVGQHRTPEKRWPAAD
jgi:hypothetical protein